SSYRAPLLRPSFPTRRSSDLTYDAAPIARVVTIDRGRYTLLAEDGTELVAMKSRPLGRQGVVVGDDVRVVGDLSGRDGSLARIVDRKSTRLNSSHVKISYAVF